ncbi:hypothetical protein E2C01_009593 [Portunus trituberculatus]|uniref:Uncharacterized protein n=1 Tax=Portunus trituberculatus TaxID=210409 RepID=A0A5B7D669_PORTR|nr:hypothetical protein [Portunus trituberculatus]
MVAVLIMSFSLSLRMRWRDSPARMMHRTQYGQPIPCHSDETVKEPRRETNSQDLTTEIWTVDTTVLFHIQAKPASHLIPSLFSARKSILCQSLLFL